MSPWDASRGRGREGNSLGELHPGDGTIVMAYLEVVGGGNAGAEHSNAGKYEDAKVPEEHKRKFKARYRKETQKPAREAVPPREA